jgi:hypothetical protein
MTMKTFDRSRNDPERCKNCGWLETQHTWICDCGEDLGPGVSLDVAPEYRTPVPCHGGASLVCPRVLS